MPKLDVCPSCQRHIVRGEVCGFCGDIKGAPVARGRSGVLAAVLGASLLVGACDTPRKILQPVSGDVYGGPPIEEPVPEEKPSVEEQKEEVDMGAPELDEPDEPVSGDVYGGPPIEDEPEPELRKKEGAEAPE